MKPNATKLIRFALALLCSAGMALSATAEGEELKEGRVSYTQADGKITVKIDGELFTEYVYGDGSTKPYLYPIMGPTGAMMTRGWPMNQDNKDEEHDHPHHQSMWFTHGGIGGHDFWHAKGDNPPKVVAGAGVATSASLEERNVSIFSNDLWQKPDGGEVLRAQTGIDVHVLENGTRIIDYSTTMRTTIASVLFADTKEGTMAIRVHPALRLKGKVATGHCINSEGDKDGACWGKRAKWVAYWGVIDGKTCGVAVFDHPTNLRHPTWWHARDYGLVAANPFGISDFEKKPKGTGDYTLKAGEELKLKYRFVFFAGTAEEADIKGKYEQWVKETTEQDQPKEKE